MLDLRRAAGGHPAKARHGAERGVAHPATGEVKPRCAQTSSGPPGWNPPDSGSRADLRRRRGSPPPPSGLRGLHGLGGRDPGRRPPAATHRGPVQHLHQRLSRQTMEPLPGGAVESHGVPRQEALPTPQLQARAPAAPPDGLVRRRVAQPPTSTTSRPCWQLSRSPGRRGPVRGNCNTTSSP